MRGSLSEIRLRGSACARSSPRKASNSRSSAQRSRRREIAAARRLPGDREGARGVQIVAHGLVEALLQGRELRQVQPAGGVAHLGRGPHEPVVARRGRFHGLVAEHLLLAVVGLEEEVAEGQGRMARGDEIVEDRHVALRLRHLLAAQLEELVVQPEPHPRVHVEAALGLGDLVAVVDGDVVDAAGVDVEGRAQVLGAHGRALEVPAGEARAPGRIPLLQALAGLRVGELPEREVRRMALAGHVADAGARLLPREVQAREVRVARELRGVEVDAVLDAVGVPLLLQHADHVDLLGDVLGRLADDLRRQAAGALAIGEPLAGCTCRRSRRRSCPARRPRARPCPRPRRRRR